MNEVVLSINEYHHDYLDSYHKINTTMHALESKNIVTLLEEYDFTSKELLDLGTGTGFLPLLFLKRKISFHSFMCADISQNILNEAERRIHKEKGKQELNFSFKKLDSQILPFENKSFDVLMMNSVLHHLPDLDLFYKEASRVLKPNGLLLIFHEPNQYFFKHMLLRGFNKLLFACTSGLGKVYYYLRGRNSKIDPMCDHVNKKLIDNGIVSEPLSYKEIYSSIDYHGENGLSFEEPKNYGFVLEKINTSSYLGTLSYAYEFFFRRRFVTAIEKIGTLLAPKSGYNFNVVYRKESI